MQTTATTLLMPPNFYLYGSIPVSDLLIGVMLIVLASLLAVILRFSVISGGDRPPPWLNYRHRRHHHGNDQIGRG